MYGTCTILASSNSGCVWHTVGGHYSCHPSPSRHMARFQPARQCKKPTCRRVQRVGRASNARPNTAPARAPCISCMMPMARTAREGHPMFACLPDLPALRQTERAGCWQRAKISADTTSLTRCRFIRLRAAAPGDGGGGDGGEMRR